MDTAGDVRRGVEWLASSGREGNAPEAMRGASTYYPTLVRSCYIPVNGYEMWSRFFLRAA